MSVTPGTRIGAYEVVSLIGVGGMGEVYRARDLTLDRDVALKVLPDSFAADADRLARFEREAKTLAGLNHPHIAQVHGFEMISTGAGSTGRALVMELVEGDDLSQILARGPLPLDEALPIARQIAEALEAAHAQGVVHRDLKPANIKVRPDGSVKVLDFGLAKAVDGAGGTGGAAVANSPTITSPAAMTRAGVILGTAAYMAPEQAKGRVVDQRADIWSFGCVLYEMLSGAKAFDGEDVTEILGAIVKSEPDWGRLPSNTPAIVQRLLRRTLQKDRTKRLQHIGDARLDLDEALNSPEPVPPPAGTVRAATNWWRMGLTYAAVAAVGAAVAVGVLRVTPQTPPAPGRAVQFDVSLGSRARPVWSLSPDGRYVAYLQPGTLGRFEVWLRDLAKPAPERLGETAAATGGLMWSPDSLMVYTAEDKGLRRFDLRSRTSVLQSATSAWPNNPQGGRVMLPDGRILFGAGQFTNFRALQVRATDATTPFLSLDEGQHETRQGNPARVGADRILYSSFRSDGSVHACVTATINPQPRCAGPLNQSGPVHYFDGRIVFARAGTVLVRGFDVEHVAFTSEEQAIADTLSTALGEFGSQMFVSDSGVLAFTANTGDERLVWQTADGREAPAVDLGVTNNLTLSPDGRRALVVDQGTLMMIDLERGGTARLGASRGDSVWAPDGRRFVHKTAAGIVIRAVDDARESVVLSGATTGFPEDWSHDGRWIAAGLRNGPFQVALIPVDGGKPVEFLATNDSITGADEMHFSPDGKWLAFNAQNGDRQDVFVVPLPPTGQRWQVSTAGGVQARWHPSGRTLYYLEPNGMMMAVDVPAGPAFRPGAPKPLFDVGFAPASIYDDYRVAPDGRFLIKKPRAQANVRVVVNWPSLLKPPS